ncbi:ATP-binding protein [Pedobacter sp.]|uniref:PAS domain-containing sensor histidine kinase n=1 Tax=Pedobacter sp. TaxID=1411316 RepID=UPI003D7F2CFC
MNNPESILLALANHDYRAYFAFNITTNTFVYLNPAFHSLFQLPEEETTPEMLFSMVNLQDKHYLKSVYSNMKAGDFVDNIEFRILVNDGKEYFLRSSMLLKEQPQQERVLTGYIEDITDRKANIEKTLALTSKKNAILNILSHDLAGPLTAVQNFAYLLGKRTMSLEDQRVNKMVTSIERISKRCINMIQDFIKKEFIETVGVDLVKRRVNLTERIKNFMVEYFQIDNETGKRYYYEYNKENIFAEIDEDKFMQVLHNLISNAIKFTPDGGSITLNMQEEAGKVLIAVSDTGVGIPEKFHATLFEKFSDARRTGLKGEPSVGLGMSIIKTIVEWHEGKIWFISKENNGTTFYVEIPASL